MTLNDRFFEQLRAGRWYGSLSPELARTLFDAGRLEQYDTGPLYSVNSSPQGLFALLDGTIHIDRTDRTGRRVLLHVAPPGYWFGEIASAGRARTAVSVHAFSPIKAWKIAPSAVSELLVHCPELANAFSALMADRFSALIDIACAMRRPTALAQIAGRLSIIAQYCKEQDSAVDIVDLQMTQADLADMTGHTRQTVNPAIKLLQQRGVIEVGHRQITILDARGLETFAYEQSE